MAQQSNVYRPKITGILIAAILLVLLVVLVLVSTILIVFAGRDDGDSPASPNEGNKPGVTTAVPKTTTAGTTDPEEPEVIKPTYIEIDRSQTNEGTLLLIDPDHLYTRDGLVDRKNMTEDQKKSLGFVQIPGDTGYFSRKDFTLYLDEEAYIAFEAMAKALSAAVGSDLQVRNAYYYNAQLTEIRIDEEGKVNMDDLETFEHSTGMVLDLQVSVNGSVYSLTHQSQKKYYDWLRENCYQYGYVWVRDITNKYSTFRYVGIPHAAAMEEKSLDLAAYIAALSAYTLQSHLTVSDAEGNEWWIYSAKSDQATIKVAVIGDERNYVISGDNNGGLIVALNSTVFSQSS